MHDIMASIPSIVPLLQSTGFLWLAYYDNQIVDPFDITAGKIGRAMTCMHCHPVLVNNVIPYIAFYLR